ncbi:hypothetical protein SDC9_182677 [bioreactor metagenome]|uniref:Uncharacterized protein n=1 Tax=bioreactor metagenome TaxID=1076179 RepID=A0A645H9X6_9ZZZZ
MRPDGDGFIRLYLICAGVFESGQHKIDGKLVLRYFFIAVFVVFGKIKFLVAKFFLDELHHALHKGDLVLMLIGVCVVCYKFAGMHALLIHVSAQVCGFDVDFHDLAVSKGRDYVEALL